MLVALLPMLAAPDHWPRPAPADAAPHPHTTTTTAAEQGAAHEQHCHGNAASCSDAPLTSLTGLALLAAWLAMPSGTGFVRRTAVASGVMVGRALSVECRPPRALAVL